MNRADLEYIRQLNDRINGALLHIAQLKQKAYPGAIRYDDTGASKPMPENKLEAVFCLIDHEERRVNRLIDQYVALKLEAIQRIQSANIECAARHILYLRYLSRDPRTGESLEWPDVLRFVSKYHNISERHVYRLHHIAIQKLS